MKIACLVRARPHHTYFVNTIHRRHPVSLIIVERPPAGSRLRRVVRAGGIRELQRVVLNRYVLRRRRHELLSGRFGADWVRLPPDVPHLHVDNVNSAAVRARLLELGPELLLDHGTSIVRGPVLSTAPLALNLHWGLSPYYRGVRCTEWALINWDPYNVGVTIHSMTDRIDGGGIIAQRRVRIEPMDDVEAINHRLTSVGTRVIIDILDQICAGEHPALREQQAECGFLYLKKHFGSTLQQQVRHIERRGLIGAMLQAPARRERLPIVELQQASLTSA